MLRATDANAINTTAWIAFLTALSVALTLGFACAAPLAAFGAYAALRMTRSWALALVGAVWAANQVVGFAFLSFPMTAECAAWGLALGASGLLACEAARLMQARGMVVSFVAAFAAYEGFLFACTAVTGADMTAYQPLEMGRVFLINAIAFAGLVVVAKLVERRDGAVGTIAARHA